MNKVVMFVKVLVFEFVVSLVLLLITAALMYKMSLSTQTTQMIVYFIYFISTFVGGLVLGKIQNSKRFLWGLCAGALYLLLLVIVSFFMRSALEDDGRIVWACVCSILGGLIGGMCS